MSQSGTLAIMHLRADLQRTGSLTDLYQNDLFILCFNDE
ncbi:unnamed protein product [Callosobruchus maculatus]|uniref:Uncharacterized protein n=1 Tax=Callosobruchus maculatus TaxID=64391 RepID=A0A653CTT7_CALMS|nr:unnamed protein product [Callosobruchus maculatus]